MKNLILVLLFLSGSVSAETITINVNGAGCPMFVTVDSASSSSSTSYKSRMINLCDVYSIDTEKYDFKERTSGSNFMSHYLQEHDWQEFLNYLPMAKP